MTRPSKVNELEVLAMLNREREHATREIGGAHFIRPDMDLTIINRKL